MSFAGIFKKDYPKFSLEVHYTATPGDPGNTSGPPERCYPAEPDELEFDKVYLIIPEGKLYIDILALDVIDELAIDLEGIADEIWESINSNAEPDPPEEEFNYFGEEGKP